MKETCSRFFAVRSVRLSAFAVIFLLVFVVLPSFSTIRFMLAAPLVVHEANARGNACYVLAGGGSLAERLDAAADLVQMGRVSKILLMKDDSCGQYSFKAQNSWTRTAWAMDYLAWRGISADKITLLPSCCDRFGTLQEARNVARFLPGDVARLVVVSSAPHMRRAVLAFRRSLPESVQVVPFAATGFKESHEMFYPIWIEYMKLLVYSVIA